MLPCFLRSLLSDCFSAPTARNAGDCWSPHVVKLTLWLLFPFPRIRSRSFTRGVTYLKPLLHVLLTSKETKPTISYSCQAEPLAPRRDLLQTLLLHPLTSLLLRIPPLVRLPANARPRYAETDTRTPRTNQRPRPLPVDRNDNGLQLPVQLHLLALLLVLAALPEAVKSCHNQGM
jgi:hypothetical protein